MPIHSLPSAKYETAAAREWMGQMALMTVMRNRSNKIQISTHLISKSYVLHHRPKIKQKETYSIQNILPKYRPNEKFSINTSYIKNT